MGIISLILFVFGILSVLLPVASAVPYGGSGISITTGQLSFSGNTTNVPIRMSNHGFLPVYGIFLNLTALNSNGSVISSEGFGPFNLPAGATVPVTFSGGISSVNSTQSNMTIKGVAKFNLADILPISISFSANMSQSGSNPVLP